MTPRAPQENQRIREERKLGILNAAIKVFTSKGYSATKISDIAAAANVSHGLLYHYFRSKEEVYAELADQLEQGARAIGYLAGQSGAPSDRVRQMLEMLLSSVWAMPDYYVLAVQVMTTEGVAPSVAEKVFRGGMESARAMAAVIAEGQAAGVFRPGDPVQHFHLLYAVITGLAVNHASAPRMLQEPVAVEAETILRLIEP